jgi:hypothetical protein
MATMTFTVHGRTYMLDGDKVPSVTTILGSAIPKPALVPWASNAIANFVINRLHADNGTIHADQLIHDLNDLNTSATRPRRITSSGIDNVGHSAILAGVPYAERDAAANRGTEVHTLGSGLASGLELDVPDAIAGHVGHYLNFLDQWQPTSALLEVPGINHRWRYAGRFDMHAYFSALPTWLAERLNQDYGHGLIDLKTSRSGVYPETALQLEAYRNFDTILVDGAEQPMPHVDFTAAVWIRADGYDVYAFDTFDQTRPTVFDRFLYAKQVADWLDWPDYKTAPAATVKSPALPAPDPAP